MGCATSTPRTHSPSRFRPTAFNLPPSLDIISRLPDECLASIFTLLDMPDRRSCTLVCWRWLHVEAHIRDRITLRAEARLITMVPSLSLRYSSLKRLALSCDQTLVSIDDDCLSLISRSWSNLLHLKRDTCGAITDVGMIESAANFTGLQKLTCHYCQFGAQGLNAFISSCESLERLEVRHLYGIAEGTDDDVIVPGIAFNSLRRIFLTMQSDGQRFGPLIVSCWNLRILQLSGCGGDWDGVLDLFGQNCRNLVEFYVEGTRVTDDGLRGIANSTSLESLRLGTDSACTDLGLSWVAQSCRVLRKLHIDGQMTNAVGDNGVRAIARKCRELEELALVGANVTSEGLACLAYCTKLKKIMSL